MTPGKKRLICVVKLNEKTDKYLNISLSEIKNNTETIIGWIKLCRNISEPINNIKGKSAIIIHDVAGLKGSQLTNAALGALALAYGTYILVKMDGDWERIGKSYKDLTNDSKSQIKKLMQENSKLKTQNYELNQKILGIKKDYTTEKQKMQLSIRMQKNMISTLEKKIEDLSNTVDNVCAKIKPEPLKTKKKIYLSKFLFATSKQKICFVGGSEKWQLTAKTIFSDAIFINGTTFDENNVRTSDLLIVNTTFTSHASTKKAIDVANKSNIKVIYTNKNNLNNMARDLLKSLILL